MSIKKGKYAIGIVILLIFSLVIITNIYTAFRSRSIDENNRKMLKKYDWNVVEGGLSSQAPVSISIDLKNDLDKMKVEASQKIGINPNECNGKSVFLYYYTLGQIGKEAPLGAVIWIYEGKIVCAYILHTENNMTIRYWALNTPYSEIVNYLENL